MVKAQFSIHKQRVVVVDSGERELEKDCCRDGGGAMSGHNEAEQTLAEACRSLRSCSSPEYRWGRASRLEA